MPIYTNPAAQASANSFFAYVRHHAVSGDNPVGDLINALRADPNFPTGIDGPEQLRLFITFDRRGSVPHKAISQLWKNYVNWLDAHNADLPIVKSRPISKAERLQLRRKELPYGMWVTASGREILFNRRYKPIWQRTPDGTITPGNRDEWVRDIIEKRHFYKSSTDETEDDRLHQAVAAARSWGVPIPCLYFKEIQVHG